MAAKKWSGVSVTHWKEEGWVDCWLDLEGYLATQSIPSDHGAHAYPPPPASDHPQSGVLISGHIGLVVTSP